MDRTIMDKCKWDAINIKQLLGQYESQIHLYSGVDFRGAGGGVGEAPAVPLLLVFPKKID